MTNTQNVKYANFKLDNLFNIRYGKFIPKRKAGTKVPFITTRSGNNGIAYYVDSKPMSQGDALTIASDGSVGETYYQDKPFSASNIVVIMEPHSNVKAKWSPQSALYIAASIKRYAQTQFDWSHKYSVNRVRATELILPVTPLGTPDFEYMEERIRELEEERIRELEEERIRELEAYLKVTGLSDATLTKADQDALDKMNNGGVKWKKFKIGDLFERTSLPRKIKQFKKKRDVSTEMTQDFNLPLVNSKVGNNGIMYYGKSEQWNAAKLTIDIIQDGAVGAGMVYAQPDSTGVLYNAYLINWKNNQEPINAKHILFFASSLRKVLYGTYNYQRKATWDRVQDDFISLPITSSGDIDFDFMENYITAIEKQSIRGVIEYKDKVIQTTKDVVNAN